MSGNGGGFPQAKTGRGEKTTAIIIFNESGDKEGGGKVQVEYIGGETNRCGPLLEGGKNSRRGNEPHIKRRRGTASSRFFIRKSALDLVCRGFKNTLFTRAGGVCTKSITKDIGGPVTRHLKGASIMATPGRNGWRVNVLTVDILMDWSNGER